MRRVTTTHDLGEVPEIQYTYTCVDGDARRFTHTAMRYWLRNRGLAIVMAFETALLVFLSVVTDTWWFLFGVPVIFLFFAGISYWNASRAHRRFAAPGNVLAAGYGDTAFRLVDNGIQLTVAYARIESVTRDAAGLMLKLKKGRRILIPAENAPAEAEAKIRAGMAAATR